MADVTKTGVSVASVNDDAKIAKVGVVQTNIGGDDATQRTVHVSVPSVGDQARIIKAETSIAIKRPFDVQKVGTQVAIKRPFDVQKVGAQVGLMGDSLRFISISTGILEYDSPTPAIQYIKA